VLAEQGCGGRSVLVIRGARRASLERLDAGSGHDQPGGAELPDLVRGLARSRDARMVESAAPRIAVDGPDDPSELEAIASVFELVERHARSSKACCGRWGTCTSRRSLDDASAAFDAAATAGGKEPEARRHLDRARMHVVMDERARRSATPSEVWRRPGCGTRREMSCAMSSRACSVPPAGATRRSRCSTSAPRTATSASTFTTGSRASGWRAAISRAPGGARASSGHDQHPRRRRHAR